jgi:hypothetical protein
MTRINVVPPSELCDKHLLAEYRELPRVFRLARPCPDAPKEYTLGTGHVKFFYDKLRFLNDRFFQIVWECNNRKFNIKHVCAPAIRAEQSVLLNDYVPTPEALALNRARIAERLAAMKSSTNT